MKYHRIFCSKFYKYLLLVNKEKDCNTQALGGKVIYIFKKKVTLRNFKIKNKILLIK